MPAPDGMLYGVYDYRLVGLSIVIAIFASYTALDLVGRVMATSGDTRRWWLAGGATALGLGIWSMHYVGMLAFSLPVLIQYDWRIVLISLLAAIAASGVALYVVTRPQMGMANAVAGSVLMGTGIAMMHYVGMAAMRLSGMCHYNMAIVALSVFLAMVVAFVGLRLLFQVREEKTANPALKLMTAVVLGAAIPVMHYTGMAASSFTASPEAPDLSNAVTVTGLGLAASVPKLTGSESEASLDGVPVLIVDDNPTNRRILEITLKQWGMKPTLAASGWEALAEMHRVQDVNDPVPLILLDSQMPQLDGFSTAAKIRQDPELPAVKIMMLTSGGQRGDADRCRQLGISAYLSKPVRQWELRESILRVLGLKPQKKESSGLVTRHSLKETSKHLRILLVEDNSVNRELASRILSKRGHSVVVAGNGLLALESLEKQDFDLILMDVQMPEMDGFEATAAIRRNEAITGTHLLIVAMTAHAMTGDRERCLGAGMDAYVSKPIQADELTKIVESFASVTGSTKEMEEPLESAMDRAVALARVDGDETLLADLAKLFCQESPKMLAAVQQAVAGKDPDAIQRAAHSLKGAVSTLAAQKSFDAALRLERLGRSGDMSDVDEAYAALEAQVRRLQSALETAGVGDEAVHTSGKR